MLVLYSSLRMKSGKPPTSAGARRAALGRKVQAKPMCWSGEASSVLAAAGLAGAGYAALKKNPEPAALWICLLYFSSMEGLQAVSYSVINQCANPLNQVLTLLGYLHISFQPFFINAVALYFMPKDLARRLAPWVYVFCFIGALSMIVQLYPFAWAGPSAPGRPLCGEILCTVRGEWHLAWNLPVNGLGNSFIDNRWLGFGHPGYAFTELILPFLYGSWRFMLFSYAAGPLAAGLTTSNVNEWPAVWCLFSIVLCLTIIKTPLRRHLYVQTPYWRWLAELICGPAPAPVTENAELSRKSGATASPT